MDSMIIDSVEEYKDYLKNVICNSTALSGFMERHEEICNEYQANIDMSTYSSAGGFTFFILSIVSLFTWFFLNNRLSQSWGEENLLEFPFVSIIILFVISKIIAYKVSSKVDRKNRKKTKYEKLRKSYIEKIYGIYNSMSKEWLADLSPLALPSELQNPISCFHIFELLETGTASSIEQAKRDTIQWLQLEKIRAIQLSSYEELKNQTRIVMNIAENTRLTAMSSFLTAYNTAKLIGISQSKN